MIGGKMVLCDREPDITEEAIAQAEAFSRHFIKTFEKRYEEMEALLSFPHRGRITNLRIGGVRLVPKSFCMYRIPWRKMI